MTPKNEEIVVSKFNKKFFISDSVERAKQRRLLSYQLELLKPFVDSIANVFSYGFSDVTTKRTEAQIINEALKYSHDLIGGVLPDLRINYHQLLLSKGLLTVPVSRIYQIKKTITRLEWVKSINERGRKGDKVYWVQYNATRNQTKVSVKEGIRNKGFINIKTNVNTIDDELHYWIFYTSLNGKQRSNSTYLGQLNTSVYTNTFHFVGPKTPSKAKPLHIDPNQDITK